tara:strand:+ start:355 stop:480 length:126 start_codon:yes stop_codon:yes gene_type:complete
MEAEIASTRIKDFPVPRDYDEAPINQINTNRTNYATNLITN